MKLEVFDLGRIPYEKALSLMQRRSEQRIAGEVDDALFMVEHPPVLTLGRSGRRHHILATEEALKGHGIQVIETGRGGDVTYHGPGQIIFYPVLSLAPHRKDVRRYVSDLEQVMMDVCEHFGLPAGRLPGQIGCWIDGQRKVGAIGVRIAKWVTTHGFALNVHPNMAHFELIVPCGISDKAVTSLAQELGTGPDYEATKQLALRAFQQRFGF